MQKANRWAVGITKSVISAMCMFWIHTAVGQEVAESFGAHEVLEVTSSLNLTIDKVLPKFGPWQDIEFAAVVYSGNDDSWKGIAIMREIEDDRKFGVEPNPKLLVTTGNSRREEMMTAPFPEIGIDELKKRSVGFCLGANTYVQSQNTVELNWGPNSSLVTCYLFVKPPAGPIVGGKIITPKPDTLSAEILATVMELYSQYSEQ